MDFFFSRRGCCFLFVLLFLSRAQKKPKKQGLFCHRKLGCKLSPRRTLSLTNPHRAGTSNVFGSRGEVKARTDETGNWKTFNSNYMEGGYSPSRGGGAGGGWGGDMIAMSAYSDMQNNHLVAAASLESAAQFVAV